MFMRRTKLARLLRQRENREAAAERGIVAERRIATDGAETGSRVGQTGREANAGPATDTGQHCDVLLAAVLIGRDVADDTGWSLELVELLAGLGVDRLEVAFERSVEHHAAACR